MIYPQKNKLIKWFFHNYIMRIVAQNFEQVKFNDIPVDRSKPVLLIANHFSWWDGFLMYYINHQLLKKQFHVMVLEETVKKIGFFRYLGAFSVSKGSRDAIKSINYAAELLNDPDNLVLIFPQGELHSNFADAMVFEKGITRIAERSGAKHQIIFSATFVENLQYKKPTASVYLKTTAEQKSGADVIDLQQAYQEHYNDALAQQTKLTV